MCPDTGNPAVGPGKKLPHLLPADIHPLLWKSVYTYTWIDLQIIVGKDDSSGYGMISTYSARER